MIVTEPEITNMLVSIVIPVYDTGNYIATCLDSVISQSHSKLEIIIVDDGSPDNAAVIAEEYAGKDNRITVIRQANVGLSGARNTGIAQMQGDYVLFLDSDDTLKTDAVERLLTKACENDSDIVIPDRYHKVYEDSTAPSEELSFERDCWINDPVDFAFTVMIGKGRAWRSTSVLYKTSIIHEYGVHFPVGYTAEDIVFNLSFLTNAKRIDFVDYATLLNLKRSGSITSSYRKDLFDVFMFIDGQVRLFSDRVCYDSSKMQIARDSLLSRNIAVFITLEMSKNNNISLKEKRNRILNVLNSPRVKEAFSNHDLLTPYWNSKAKSRYVVFIRLLIKHKLYSSAILTAGLCTLVISKMAK